MTDPRTDPTTPSPAWERDADKLWYTARGLAEHDINTNLKESGIYLTADQVELARLTISTATSTVIQVLQTAGWMRDEPAVAFEETPFVEIFKVARARLAAWENRGLS